jgi:hypothetical protein
VPLVRRTAKGPHNPARIALLRQGTRRANACPIVDDDSVLDHAVRRFISGIMNAQPPTRRSQADPSMG